MNKIKHSDFREHLQSAKRRIKITLKSLPGSGAQFSTPANAQCFAFRPWIFLSKCLNNTFTHFFSHKCGRYRYMHTETHIPVHTIGRAHIHSTKQSFLLGQSPVCHGPEKPPLGQGNWDSAQCGPQGPSQSPKWIQL